jgi:hypothetical protein
MPIRGSRRFISYRDLKSGMLLEFKYQKKSGETKIYNVLTIDPQISNQYTNNLQLHGIVVDEMNDVELKELISSIGPLTIDAENRRASLTDLANDEAYAKFKSQYVSRNIYRTFNKANISLLRQILLGNIAEMPSKLRVYQNIRKYSLAELEDAAGEYFENEYTFSRFPGLSNDKQSFINVLLSAPVVILSRTDLLNLDNSDVGEILQSNAPMKEVEIMMATQGRQNDLSRILYGIRNRSSLPLPIVLQSVDGYYLLGGNSRLCALAALGYTMSVKKLTYMGLKDE